jgi:hypothetical protein
MDDKRLSERLETWARWQRMSDVNIGFPPRSVPFMSGGSVSPEDSDLSQSEAYWETDKTEAKVTQACIDDLPGKEHDAVFNVVMGASRPLGEPLQVVYLRAREMLMLLLRRRGAT